VPSYSNPAALGAPYGLYSHMAHCEGPLHFVAGQLAIQEDGSVLGKNDLPAQLAEVLSRISAAAASVGLSLENVVQFTTYLAGRELIPEFYKAREKLFAHLYPDGKYPPNTLLAVAGLVEPDLLVEIQAILAP
jgi:enamine deaminase RidA (YjgF/YER057c/UK114 family)